MLKVVSMLAVVALVSFTGCKAKDCGCGDKADMKASAMDACSHCDGVQTATADGKCPACGMKVK